jgi:tRNA A37 methylthiotransferase MiaB
MSTPRGSVALVTLGCTRNEVDSEELAGRLAAEGWTLVEDAADADVAVVNTCGFVEQAKKDSIDTLLEAADLKRTGRTRAVVAVGCLAERYGQTLADELPDADAVLGFDSYRAMSSHLTAVPLRRRFRRGRARSRRRGGAGVRPGEARRPTVGTVEDRQRVRPTLLVLRHPDVPGVVRVAASD